MKKNLLIWVFCFYSSIAFSQFSASKETSLSTAAIYTDRSAAVWGDITGSGKLDVVSEISSPHYQYLGVITDILGKSSFSAQDHMSKVQHNFYGSCLGDLDGDGDLDLVTAGPNGDNKSPNNVYYWSSSSSRFELVGSTYSIDGKAFYGNSTLIGDFTNDGKLDVMWFGSKYDPAIYLGINSTTTADKITFSSIKKLGNKVSNFKSGNFSVASGDFNGDGNLDVVTTNNAYNSGNYGGNYQLFLGNGDGTFNVSIAPLGTKAYISYAVTTKDINKDGKTDFIVSRGKFSPPYGSEIILYTRNKDNTGFDEKIIFSSSNIPGSVKMGDINKDGNIDIVSQSNRGNLLSVFFNQGNEKFNSTPDLSFKTIKVNQFFLRDIDKSGYQEIVTLSSCKVSYFKIGYRPNAPKANNETYIYDRTLRKASATAPKNSSIVWYATEKDDVKASAPTATNVGIYEAYASSKDLKSNFESENRTLVRLTINKANLSVSNASVSNKIYDGNKNAIISGAKLNGVLGADQVVLSNDKKGLFASKNAGKDIAITTQMQISGNSATNYKLLQPNLVGNIARKQITIDAKAESKIYDGTKVAILTEANLVDIIKNDDVALTNSSTATFTDKNVGTQIQVDVDMNLKGKDANNYDLLQGKTKANILPKKIMVNASAKDKIYDGTTVASISKAFCYGLIKGDDATLSDQKFGTFVTPNSGTHIEVNTSMTLSGKDAKNYTIQQPILRAKITPCPIEITANANSKIANSNDPKLTYKITSGKLLKLDNLTGTLSREKGEKAGSYKIELGSLSAGKNYTITFIPAEFKINEIITGINDMVKTETKIYPVPTSNTLTVSSPKIVKEIFLISSTGKILRSLKPKQNKFTIHVADLISGHYILVIKTENTSINKAFIKL